MGTEGVMATAARVEDDVRPGGVEGEKKVDELRNLLVSAGYEAAGEASSQQAQVDAQNYLQLLVARQAQLQIEHQHMVALVGSALTSTMASVNALRRNQQVAPPTGKTGGTEGREGRARRQIRVLPDRARLSYERLFESCGVASAILSADGAVSCANEKFRRDSARLPEGGLPEIGDTPRWLRPDLAVLRLDASENAAFLCSEPPDVPDDRPAPRLKRPSAVLRAPVEDEDQYVEHRQQQQPPPPPKKHKADAAKAPRPRTGNPEQNRPSDAKLLPQSSQQQPKHPPNREAQNDLALPTTTTTTTRCGRAVKPRR